MPQGTCSVDGCPKAARNRGWCSAHYERWRRNGDPGPAGDGRKRAPKFCTVDACDKRSVRRSGYCAAHHYLWEKHGDPTINLRPTYGSRRIVRPDGYVCIYEPEHPLAKADGYVYEHRKVVFDAGIVIPDGYHVHHKNGDKADNRLENLEVVDEAEHHRHHIREAGFVVNQFGVWPVKR